MTEDTRGPSTLGLSAFGGSTFSGRVIMCQGVTPPSADSGGCPPGGRDCPYRSRGLAPESAIDRPLGSSSWLKSRSAPKSLAVDFLTADEGDCPSYATMALSSGGKSLLWSMLTNLSYSHMRR